MARLVLLFALIVLPALAVATRPMKTPFTVEGQVFCDSCRFGYETKAIKVVAGAKVRVECKDKTGTSLKYSKEGTTDSTGTYRIPVSEDHEDQICDTILLSSPEVGCSEVVQGRDRARVILTEHNGIASCHRFANAMLFQRTLAMSGCTKILEELKALDV